jgi:hypothetical protein
MERDLFWPCAWQARRSEHAPGCFGRLLHHQQCLRHLQLLGLHLGCCPQNVQALHLHQGWRLHRIVSSSPKVDETVSGVFKVNEPVVSCLTCSYIATAIYC